MKALNWDGILAYTARAARFGLAAAALYALLRVLWLWRTKRPFKAKNELRLLALAFYAAALVEITAIRGGADWAKVFAAKRSLRDITLVPLTNLAGLRAWPLVYNVLGNILWFVPLGLLLRWRAGFRGFLRAALLGCALSATIELSQWLLLSGVPDVDDVVLNTAGACLGWLFRLMGRKIART